MRKVVLLLAIVICTGLIGCDAIFPETPVQDKMMVEALEAIQSHDIETLDDFTVPELDFNEALCKEIDDYVKGKYVESERISYHYNFFKSNNDQNSWKQWTNQYRVKTNKDEYIVNMTVISRNGGPIRISQFYITSKDDIAKYQRVNRTYNFGIMNATQYGLFVYYLLQWLFAIFCIVVCIKSKIRFKWLWILIIILGFSGITYTISGSGFRFNFLLLGLPQSYIKLGEIKSFALTIPLGSTIFLLLRRNLIKKRQVHDQNQVQEKSISEANNKV